MEAAEADSPAEAVSPAADSPVEASQAAEEADSPAAVAEADSPAVAADASDVLKYRVIFKPAEEFYAQYRCACL